MIFFEYPTYSNYVDPKTGARCFGIICIHITTTFPTILSLTLCSGRSFDPDRPYDTLLSKLHPGRGWYPFLPYPLNVAELIPESPIVDIPKYQPWFNPNEDQVVSDIPMPDALPPSPTAEPRFNRPRVLESSWSVPSSAYSSEVWIDQMMTDLYSSSFETGKEDSTEDVSSNNITDTSE
ncbi:hypothetical protein S83_056128 [Arachis hypogaea]